MGDLMSKVNEKVIAALDGVESITEEVLRQYVTLHWTYAAIAGAAMLCWIIGLCFSAYGVSKIDLDAEPELHGIASCIGVACFGAATAIAFVNLVGEVGMAIAPLPHILGL